MVADLIKAEVNVKEIELLADTTGIISKKAKANFKTLGKRLGGSMKAASQIIGNLSQAEIAGIERTGKFDLNIEGQIFELTSEDFEIVSEDIPGWQVANDREITVALDITITDGLLVEGMARELVNRIQNIRKNSDFEVTDRIIVSLEDHPALRPTIASFASYITSEVLADDLILIDQLKEGESVDLTEELALMIAVKKSN